MFVGVDVDYSVCSSRMTLVNEDNSTIIQCYNIIGEDTFTAWCYKEAPCGDALHLCYHRAAVTGRWNEFSESTFLCWVPSRCGCGWRLDARMNARQGRQRPERVSRTVSQVILFAGVSTLTLCCRSVAGCAECIRRFGRICSGL